MEIEYHSNVSDNALGNNLEIIQQSNVSIYALVDFMQIATVGTVWQNALMGNTLTKLTVHV